MKKISVTYHAPKGDSKVVEMLGHTFHDGKAEEVEGDDALIARLQTNQHFECGQPSEVDPKKRDPAKEKAAADAAARDDAAKRAAQEQHHVLRGAANPNLPAEGDDKGEDKSSDKDKTPHR